MRTPQHPPGFGRARLERALLEASDEWQRSRWVRLRAALAVAPARTALGVAVALALVVWAAEPRIAVWEARVDSHVPLPNAALTPGAVSSLTAADLCAGARPARLVTADARREVLRNYRMEGVPELAYELDALITPELGGSTDPRNLWPQRYASPVWNARVKDELEQLLPELVCSGRVNLRVAQRDMATDWVAAYQRYFKTAMPLQAHVGPALPDDDLELAPLHDLVADARALGPIALFFLRP